MFCPQCGVEYRPGFTHCTDCDVDLVDAYIARGGHPQVRKQELPHELSAHLWRGSDPHFYLRLIASLGSKNVPCFGRPANPPMYHCFAEQPPGSDGPVEFAVLVSEENLSFARWVLSSEAEMNREQEADSKDFGEEGEDPEVGPGVTGICPLCLGEFRERSTVCPNCGVALRPPHRASLEQNPGRTLCDLPHPQFLADLRMALNRETIPFNNANFPNGPDTRRTDVTVLKSDFERATRFLAQVLQYWEFDRSINFGPSHDPRESYYPHRAHSDGWYPEDLEFLLWAGSNLYALDGIGMALREHQIAYRVEITVPRTAKLFIHPDDERPAKAVLQDVLEGVPPQ